MKHSWSTLLLLPLTCGSIACAPATAPAEKPAAVQCLAPGSGFFKAQLDGALQTQLEWANEGTLCEGGPRPDGNGVRVSFTRRADDGKGLLVVVGIAGVSESSSGRALPANVTVIDERSNRVFSTLGDDKCTVDELRQELIGEWRKEQRTYRVSGRGFCMQPARAVAAEDSVLVSTFDFVGKAVYQ